MLSFILVVCLMLKNTHSAVEMLCSCFKKGRGSTALNHVGLVPAPGVQFVLFVHG